MEKKSEIRLLTGGVNSDDTSNLIQPNELINAINVTGHNSYDKNNQTVGALTPVYDSVPLSNVNLLLPTVGVNTLIGTFADEREGFVIYFFHNSLGLNRIIKSFDNTGTILLTEGSVVGGLGWTSGMYISARTQGNILVFADGIHEVRYIDHTKIYGTGSLTQTMLTLITESYAAPLRAFRITDTTFTTAFPVQYGAFQFCYRIQNDDGFYSVLSVLSETVLPVRNSANPFFGNLIDCQLNFDVKIPTNWRRIDFVVKYLDSNTFFVYESLFDDVPNDIIKVNDHNSGIAPLSCVFNGTTIESLDAITAFKQFDSIPIRSKLVEVVNNRVVLGDNVVGYNTPTIAPSNLTLAGNTYIVDEATSTTHNVYLLLAKNYDVNEEDYPIYGGLFVSFGGEIYSLPLEYSRLRFNGGDPLYCSTKNPLVYPYLLPKRISKSALIKIDSPFREIVFPPPFASTNRFAYIETFSNAINNGFNLNDGTICFNRGICRCVWQIHDLGNLADLDGVVTAQWFAALHISPPFSFPVLLKGYVGLSRFCMTSGSDFAIEITDEPVDAMGSKNRAFLPTASYKYGIRYYDVALRACGNLDLGEYKVGDYTPYNRTLTESLDLTLSGAPVIPAPSWAKYFGITLTKNSVSTDFLNFAPNCIKVARKTKDGIIYVTSDIKNNVQNDEMYGIAVPLDGLAKYNKGYVFNEGDYISLAFDDATSSTLSFVWNSKILGVIDGHVIAAPSDLNLLEVHLSSQYSLIRSPVYDAVAGYVRSNNPLAISSAFRQQQCYATIYIGVQPDSNFYEIGCFGLCEDLGSGNQLSKFFLGTGYSTTFRIFGDCYTQRRESRASGFMGLSNTTNENTQTIKWVEPYGRLSPVDRVGQQVLSNEVRWGNVGLPNAAVDGLASFDAADYKLMPVTAGSVNMLQAQIGDSNSNNGLLIICKSSGYYTLVEQSFLRSTTNQVNVTQSSGFIDNINELNGRPSTSSPRSFAIYNGTVLWVDALNRKVWMFKTGDTLAISDLKANRLWNLLLDKAENDPSVKDISGGINRITGEYLVSMAFTTITSKSDLPTTTIENPLSFYYDKAWTWVFNIKDMKWTNIIDKRRIYVNVSTRLYSYDGSLLYFEDEPNNSSIGDSTIVIPFNAEYNLIKHPLNLKLDASRPPDETWIQTDTNTRFDLGSGSGSTMVATTSNWIYRESMWQAAILRDRMSNNANNNSTWNASNIKGQRLKGKTINVILIWYKANGRFSVRSCELDYTR